MMTLKGKITNIAKTKPWILSLLTGLLLCISWPPIPLAPLLFVAFVPLLYVVRQQKGFWKVMGHWFMAMFIFSVGTMYWIYNARFMGVDGFIALCTFPASAFLLTIPAACFVLIKKKYGFKTGLILLPAFWVAGEYMHYWTDMGWPWLNLGFGLSQFPLLMQFYEFTGVLGGSLWILTTNLLFFHILYGWEDNNARRKNLLALGIVSAIVLVFSLWPFFTLEASKQKIKVAIIQANIDPYKQAGGTITYQEIFNKYSQLTKSVKEEHPDIVVWAEAALQGENIHIDELDQDPHVLQLKELSKQMDAPILTGFIGFKIHNSIASTSKSSTPIGDGRYYDSCTAAM